MEDQLIRQIKGGILGIKNGTKTVADAGLNSKIEMLRKVNEGMAEELHKQYIDTVRNLKK